jgi:hypothetical protein
MSKRYPGGLISKTPVVPTTSSAPGVWTLDQARSYTKAGTWPIGTTYNTWISELIGSGDVRSISIAADSSNNIYITGYTSLNDPGYFNTILIKISQNADIQWQRSLGNSTTYEYGNGVGVDSSGNAYIAGTADFDYLIAKYDTLGNLQWQRRLANATYTQYCSDATADASGNIYITGAMIDPAGVTLNKAIIKYNTSGTLQWQRSLGSNANNEYGYSIAVDPGGNSYICGTTDTGFSSANFDILIAKYNTSGTIQWQRTLGGAGGGTNDQFSYGIAADPGGNSYICGSTTSGSLNGSNTIIAKYNTSGTLQWQRTLGGASINEVARSIAVDSSNNVYICGDTNIDGGARDASFLAKYDTNGNIQWQRNFVNDNYDHAIYGIAVDSNIINSIYFVGYYSQAAANNRILIVKVPADGSLTGSYTVGNSLYTYVPSSIANSASSFTNSASTLTSSTSTLSNTAPTLANAAITLSQTTKSI